MNRGRVAQLDQTTATTPAAGLAPPGRIAAIDALRGFDMFWIVGGRELLAATVGLLPQSLRPWADVAKSQLEHTKWEGFTAWDLIMPLFLFVVGAAMPFSFSRRRELGQSRAALFVKILRRTLILFILGMAVQGNLLEFDLSKLHPFANTLQAIAVGYLVAGILLLTVPIWVQPIATLMLMLGYWWLLTYLNVPGHGAGVLEPHANVAFMVDQWVLGDFIDHTEPPYTWVLSGMTFAASVLLGVMGGHILRSTLPPMIRFLCLLTLGLVCLESGWFWAQSLNFLIIKHIWTSSMVLWAGGWSYLLLAIFYLAIDIMGWRRWAFPFIVIGMNAITAYVMYRFIPFQKIAAGLVGGLSRHLGRGGEFAIALTTVLLVWLVLYHLYRQKIFVRI